MGHFTFALDDGRTIRVVKADELPPDPRCPTPPWISVGTAWSWILVYSEACLVEARYTLQHGRFRRSDGTPRNDELEAVIHRKLDVTIDHGLGGDA